MLFDNQFTIRTAACPGKWIRELRYSSSSCDYDNTRDVRVNMGSPWLSASAYMNGESGAVSFDWDCIDFQS